MASKPSKVDPIRQRYFRPLEAAEASSAWLFYFVAVTSVMALVVDKKFYPQLYDFTQGAFVIGVLALFIIGLGTRLYWTPRADDKRRQDLISNSFAVAITHEQTSGYYNNEQTSPLRRLCISLLENSFFSKNICLIMTGNERIRVTLYLIVWMIALINRSTDLALTAAMAQAIFSEQILSRWIRLEWLRMRFERVYENLYRLIQDTTNFNKDEFRARVIEEYGEYETGKGYGGITLSSRVFDRHNDSLSAEWEQVKQILKLN